MTIFLNIIGNVVYKDMIKIVVVTFTRNCIIKKWRRRKMKGRSTEIGDS